MKMKETKKPMPYSCKNFGPDVIKIGTQENICKRSFRLEEAGYSCQKYSVIVKPDTTLGNTLSEYTVWICDYKK